MLWEQLKTHYFKNINVIVNDFIASKNDEGDDDSDDESDCFSEESSESDFDDDESSESELVDDDSDLD